MSSLSATVPAPLPTDHEDVAWALRTAQAQWASGSYKDAVRWVERAAETAEEVGAIRRSVELLQLSASLAREVSGRAEREGSAPELSDELLEEQGASSVEIEVSETEIDDEDLEDDDDEIALEMSDATEIVELDGDGAVTLLDEDVPSDIGEEEPLPSFDYRESEGSSSDEDRDTWRTSTAEPPTVRPAAVSSLEASEPDHEPPAPLEPAPLEPTLVEPAPLPPSVRPVLPEPAPAPLPKLSAFKRSRGPDVTLSRPLKKGDAKAVPLPEALAIAEPSAPSPEPPALEALTPVSQGVAPHPAPPLSPPEPVLPIPGTAARVRAPSIPDLLMPPAASRAGNPSRRQSPDLDAPIPSRASGNEQVRDEPAPEPQRTREPSHPELDSEGWLDPLAPGALSRLEFEDEAPTRNEDSSPARPTPSPSSRYPSGPPAPLSSSLPETNRPGAKAPSSRPAESFRSTFPTEPGLDFDLSLPAEVAMSRGFAAPQEDKNELERELGIDLSLNIKAPVSAPAPPPRPKSSVPPGLIEPFLVAPSATLPPARPIEPPSRPLHAPPADSMREPDADYSEYDYPSEEEGPPGAMVSAPPVRPVELPPPSSLDVPAGVDALFDQTPGAQPFHGPGPNAAYSQGPKPLGPSSPGPNSVGSGAPGPSSLAGYDSLAPLRPYDTVVDGVHLLEVPGLGEFSKDALSLLMASARQVRLNPGEEVNSFAAALVTRGTVQLMPTVADASCATVRKGGVIFSHGSVEPGVELRVVGFDLGTRVVVFGKDEFNAALKMCPWVSEELKHAADSYQAMAGAVMGPLGESFDEMFRSMVLDKLNVKAVTDGELIAREGKPLEGIYVVGAGYFSVEGETGRQAELGPGDFVFPETLLSASSAPRNVRARGRALVLFAPRLVVHELFAICPPFIELLASG